MDGYRNNRSSYMINGDRSRGLSDIGVHNGFVPNVVVVLALTAVPTLAVSIEQQIYILFNNTCCKIYM